LFDPFAEHFLHPQSEEAQCLVTRYHLTFVQLIVAKLSSSLALKQTETFCVLVCLIGLNSNNLIHHVRSRSFNIFRPLRNFVSYFRKFFGYKFIILTSSFLAD
jgi:hypothetical protein